MGDFWRQPAKRYRNFQLVASLLTLAHFLLACGFVFAPIPVHEFFSGLNEQINGIRYYFPEDQSTYYRALAASHSLGLALILALLQWNVRAHIALLVPAVLFKVFGGTIWLMAFVARPIIAAALVCATLDFLIAALFVGLTVPAYRNALHVPEETLLPRLRQAMIPRAGS